jgi:dipeptidase E
VHPLNVIAGYEPMHVEELADYSALGLIDLFVVPHYNRFIDTNPEFERLLRELEQNAHLSFERVKDGEAIIIHGDEVKFIRGESQ